MSGLTKTVILRTFKELLKTTPLDKITVAAISRESGIGRNTFYYYYEDIYSLLDEFLITELGTYMQESDENGWQKNIRGVLQTCQDNARVVYHIYNSLSRDRLERYVFASVNDMFRHYFEREAQKGRVPEEKVEDIADFCRYAFFGYFLKFLWGNMRDDIDETVARLDWICSTVLLRGLESLPENKSEDGAGEVIQG